MSLTRDQLRAARALLHLNQIELAELARLGSATVRRYESGHNIDAPTLDALRRALEGAGALLIDGGTSVGGATVGIGVALFADAELPETTRRRIAEANTSASQYKPKGDPTPRRPPGRPRKARRED